MNGIINGTFNIPSYIEEDTVIQSKAPTDADPSWYRVHESGWVEQGGVITTGTASPSATGNTTVAFTKNMANTSYTFTCCGQTSSAVTGSNHARIMTFGYITKTTNSIIGNANYQSSGGDDYRAGKMMWKVSGQLASGQYPIVKETKRQIIKY